MTLKDAEDIMCNNFFGPEDWHKFFYRGMISSDKDEIISISSDELIKKRDKYFLFRGFSEDGNGNLLDIMRFRELDMLLNGTNFYFEDYGERPWYADKTNFAHERTCENAWYLLALAPHKESAGKSFFDQRYLNCYLIGEAGETAPSAVELVVGHLLYFMKNKIWLNQHVFLRSKDYVPIYRKSVHPAGNREIEPVPRRVIVRGSREEESGLDIQHDHGLNARDVSFVGIKKFPVSKDDWLRETYYRVPYKK